MAVMKYLGSDGLYHVLPAYVSSQVQSVNGKTGIVELNFDDIHNLPEELDKKITAPTTGEAGQLLARKADGTVEWKTVSSEEPSYIATAFDKTQGYPKDSYVFYENELYKAKDYVGTGDFTPSEWEKVKVMDELVNQEVSLDAITSKFNKSEAYTKGDYVIHNNKLYKAKVAKAAGTDFVAANWDECDVIGLLDGKVDFSSYFHAWDKTKAYMLDTEDMESLADSIVYKDGYLWTPKAPIPADTEWDEDLWNKGDLQMITSVIFQLIGNITDNLIRDSFVAPKFNAGNAYDIGDVVVYKNDVFTATAPHAPGEEWTASNWHRTKLQELVGSSDLSSVAPAFFTDDSAAPYQIGDYVTKDGKLYELNTSGAAASDNHKVWNSGYWTSTSAVKEIKKVDDAKFDNEGVAPMFAVGTVYAEGSLVVYDGRLYRAKEEVPASALTPDVNPKWEEITVVKTAESKLEARSAAEPYNETYPYGADALVTYKGTLYFYMKDEATTGKIPGVDTEYWHPITIDELRNISRNNERAVASDIAHDWNEASTYTMGDHVIHGANWLDLYTTTDEFDPATAGNPFDDTTNWKKTTVVDALNTSNNNIAEAFDAAKVYAAGAIVIHNGNLYRANDDHDAGDAWDSTKWDSTNIVANLGGAASDFRPAFITAMNLLGEVLGFTYSYEDDPDNPGSKIDKIVLN